MENMIKELKEELLNKELTLCEMDNIAEKITGSTSSIFDAPDEIENGISAYWMAEDKNIMVEYTILEENEDKTEIKVKVTDVWED